MVVDAVAIAVAGVVVLRDIYLETGVLLVLKDAMVLVRVLALVDGGLEVGGLSNNFDGDSKLIVVFVG